MLTGPVAEQGEIVGEVEGVEITPGIGEHLIRQAHGIQGHRLETVRDEMLDLLYRTLGIEGYHEQRIDLAARQTCYGLSRVAEQIAARVFYALHEYRFDIHAAEAIDISKGLGMAQRIIDRHRTSGAQCGDQSARGVDRLGMGQRLEQRVAPGHIAESRDVNRHG